MLPGNLQYWQPCKWDTKGEFGELSGTINLKINEPIHFSGPSPGYQSTITEEEKKEQPKTSEPDQHLVTDHDDPHGAAQQSPPEDINQVQRPINEETKELEPTQTVEPVGSAAMSDPSVAAHPRVNQQPIESAQQSVDANQATLQAFQNILAQ